jgi:hypothetical protein
LPLSALRERDNARRKRQAGCNDRRCSWMERKQDGQERGKLLEEEEESLEL